MTAHDDELAAEDQQRGEAEAQDALDQAVKAGWVPGRVVAELTTERNALRAALATCAKQLEAVVRWDRDMDVRDCKKLAATAREALAKGGA